MKLLPIITPSLVSNSWHMIMRYFAKIGFMLHIEFWEKEQGGSRLPPDTCVAMTWRYFMHHFCYEMKCTNCAKMQLDCRDLRSSSCTSERNVHFRLCDWSIAKNHVFSLVVSVQLYTEVPSSAARQLYSSAPLSTATPTKGASRCIKVHHKGFPRVYQIWQHK